MQYLRKASPASLIAITIFLATSVGMVDWITGEELSFFVFYFIPVTFASWNLGFGAGVTSAFLCTLAWLGVERVSGHAYSTPSLLVINLLIRWLSYTLMGYFVFKFRQSRSEIHAYAAELEERVLHRTAKLQERVAELEMLSYSVSHNLRAPLRAIDGMASALEEVVEISNSSEKKELLAKLKRSASRMDRLIIDLVDYVQLTLTKPDNRPIFPGKLLSQVIEEHSSIIAAKRAEISFSKELSPLWGQAHLLHAVLFELVRNALQFVEEGKEPHICITERSIGDWVRISILDNGIGIAHQHKHKLFGLFEQLHSYDQFDGGTGMGLAKAKKCVELMGGKIGFESQEKSGSEFWFELRRYEPIGNN